MRYSGTMGWIWRAEFGEPSPQGQQAIKDLWPTVPDTLPVVTIASLVAGVLKKQSSGK
jgi:hypothetical protein